MQQLLFLADFPVDFRSVPTKVLQPEDHCYDTVSSVLIYFLQPFAYRIEPS